MTFAQTFFQLTLISLISLFIFFRLAPFLYVHKWTLPAEMVKLPNFGSIDVKVLQKKQDLQDSSFLGRVDSRFYGPATQVAILFQQPGLYNVFVQIVADGHPVFNTTYATLRVSKGRQYARRQNPAKFAYVSFCKSLHNTTTYSSWILGSQQFLGDA